MLCAPHVFLPAHSKQSSRTMAGDCHLFPRCSLDSRGCLRLSAALQAFNAALSEEQAWALCYQGAKCMLNEWNSDSSSCYCLHDTADMLMHKDGYMHRNTVKLTSKEAGARQLAASEYELVATLGMIVFNVLDFRLPLDEERKLSRPLEQLIERMTSSYPRGGEEGGGEEEDAASQNADEGIEQDSGEDDERIIEEEDGKLRKGFSLHHVMEVCARNLVCPEQADSHYKAVCRALVAEVLELTTFLENITNRTQVLPSSDDETEHKTLAKLGIQDWARLWMQVIHQLRQGVKLKKVDPTHFHHPYEFELTPYEMLLDDIRSRRYKLRQVMVNGDIPPRVKKDAHALILEFIRSRPPLVPVSERKMPPTPPRTLTLYEKLMASIKQQHKLKPTVQQNGEGNNKRKIETSRTKLEDSDDTPQPQRRLIKPDISLGFSSSFEDLDDIPQTPIDESLCSFPLQNGKVANTNLVRSSSHTESLGSERRHSISVCESPPKSGDQTPLDDMMPGGRRLPFHESSSQARSDYWKSSQWQSLECLSLTLEEVVHIRNVLTKAELESVIVDQALYEDLRKGKVCFTCKQVRFFFFGPWGVKCKLCERTVCDKCSSKMRIPTEHFARIPVYMLSPTPSPPPEEESSHSFWRFSDVFGSSTATETVDDTPKLRKQKTICESTARRRINFRHSESVYVFPDKKSQTVALPPRKKVPIQRSRTLIHSETLDPKESKSSKKDKLKGPLEPVCRGCKVMVSNIVLASQDKVSFESNRKKKKNAKTWPQKRSACMAALTETPLSSPEETFISKDIGRLRYSP